MFQKTLTSHWTAEKAMATHSSTLGWKIPWTEEPGRLQSMGSLRVGMTERLHFHFSLSCTGDGNGNPLQCSCLENPGDGGAWWAPIYGVTQSRTLLKWLSSSSRIHWTEVHVKNKHFLELREKWKRKQKSVFCIVHWHGVMGGKCVVK